MLLENIIMVISGYFWSHELTLFSSISEPLQEKTEPTLFYTNPRQGKKINVNPHTMFSKIFIVMTAVVVAVNAHGNSTFPSTAANPASSASHQQKCWSQIWLYLTRCGYIRPTSYTSKYIDPPHVLA